MGDPKLQRSAELSHEANILYGFVGVVPTLTLYAREAAKQTGAQFGLAGAGMKPNGELSLSIAAFAQIQLDVSWRAAQANVLEQARVAEVSKLVGLVGVSLAEKDPRTLHYHLPGYPDHQNIKNLVADPLTREDTIIVSSGLGVDICAAHTVAQVRNAQNGSLRILDDYRGQILIVEPGFSHIIERMHLFEELAAGRFGNHPELQFDSEAAMACYALSTILLAPRSQGDS